MKRRYRAGGDGLDIPRIMAALRGDPMPAPYTPPLWTGVVLLVIIGIIAAGTMLFGNTRQTGVPAATPTFISVSNKPGPAEAPRVFQGRIRQVSGTPGIRVCGVVEPAIAPPPACGPVVTDLTWDAVPNRVTVAAGVTEAWVVLIGTLEGTRFSVSQVLVDPYTVVTVVDRPDDSPPPQLTCAVKSPGTGPLIENWSPDDVAGLQGVWVSPDQSTLNVASNADPTTVETQVRSSYDGPLCVGEIPGAAPYRQLQAAMTAIGQTNSDDITALGIGLHQSGGVVEVEVLSVTDDRAANLQAAAGPQVPLVITAAFPVLV